MIKDDFEMLQQKINKGIIVAEKLDSIFNFFDSSTNKFKNNFGDKNITNFFKQYYFILYSLYDLYKKTNIIFIHNDFKLDNIMIRVVNIPGDYYNYTLFNRISIQIPLIKYLDKKYLLVLNDFGESYSLNFSNNEEIIKSDNRMMFPYKYFDQETFTQTDLKKLFNNINKYIDIEVLNSKLAQPYDKYIFENEERKKIFKELQNDIRNIVKINKIRVLVNCLFLYKLNYFVK